MLQNIKQIVSIAREFPVLSGQFAGHQSEQEEIAGLVQEPSALKCSDLSSLAI